jgi:hypothetical protein
MMIMSKAHFKIAAALLVVLVVACGEDSKCQELRDELLSMIKTGNPLLDNPTDHYSKTQYAKLEDLKELDCTLPELGEAPLLCNHGIPECPDGYLCCGTGNARDCRKTCPAPDSGP